MNVAKHVEQNSYTPDTQAICSSTIEISFTFVENLGIYMETTKQHALYECRFNNASLQRLLKRNQHVCKYQ